MKVSLVYNEELTPDPRRAFGHAGYLLARRLHQQGLLAKVACRSRGPDLDLPADLVLALHDDPWCRFADELVSRAAKRFPAAPARRWREELFDRFLIARLTMTPDFLLFCSRPLYHGAVKHAKARGAIVWVQTSVPHPLLNYALVRSEEIARGLASHGAYTDRKRVDRLARTIAAADKVLTLAPEIARFTYDSYLQFVGSERILPLQRFSIVDCDQFTPPAEAERGAPAAEGTTFLHISHMNLIKGIPYLLEAWRRLKAAGDERSRLVLVGQEDGNVRRLVGERYGDLPAVEYRGFLPNLAACYREADVFVSPSIADAGPTTIVEAMAAGLPVVASRNCGFASLVTPGEDGFTYAYHDVEALTAHLQWCAGHPIEVREMGRKARRRVEALSIGGYVEELLALMDRQVRT